MGKASRYSDTQPPWRGCWTSWLDFRDDPDAALRAAGVLKQGEAQ